MTSDKLNNAAPPHPTNDRLSWVVYILVTCHYLSWLPFLNDSLWLDECGSAWLIHGGWNELLNRSLTLLHAPLFAATLQLIASVFGTSEVALRFPCWLAAGVSLYLFYMLARELFDEASSLFALAIFALSPTLVNSAIEARPYAFALISILGAYLCFLRAIATRQKFYFMGFVVCTALMVHYQILFIYMLVVPICVLVFPARKSFWLDASKWLLSGAAIAILILPLAFHYKVLFTWGGTYSFTSTPTLPDLLGALAPTRPIIFLGIAAIICLPFSKGIRSGFSRTDRFNLGVALVLTLFPLGLLFAVSNLTTAKVFVPRYYLPSLPAIALLYAWIFDRVQPSKLLILISVVLLGLTLVLQITTGRQDRETDDWRGALTRSATLLEGGGGGALVLYSGFVESANLELMKHIDKNSFIFAPLAAYAVPATQFVALPFSYDQASKHYWQAEFRRAVVTRQQFVVVLRGFGSYKEWSSYLIDDAETHGFTLQHKEHFRPFAQTSLLHFVRKVPSKP